MLRYYFTSAYFYIFDEIKLPMQSKFLISPILFSFLLLSSLSHAQTNSDSTRKNAVKTFIDCDYCDIDFIKKELNWVNYVREVKEAEVYVLISTRNNGGGGKEFSISFEGQQKFIGLNDSLVTNTSSNTTEDEERNQVVKFLKLGLIRYVARTPEANNITIDHQGGDSTESNPSNDPWKSWVMNINFNGWFQGEESYKSTSIYSSLSATKTTPDWKIEFYFNHNYGESTYHLDDEIYSNINRSLYFENFIAKSLSEHWSAGNRINITQSTYNNLSFNAACLPAIEYNIFPYSKSTRKQFRLNYSAGLSYRLYTDTTIFDKIEEYLWVEKFNVAFAMIEKWGSINSSLSWSNFFYDFRKYSLSIYSALNIRLIKGLSIQFSGNLSFIHDLRGLPKQDATTEDILLRQRQLATQYSYWLSLGISYTFGSIYNNVVNPRFGN